jgi:hypothetical protein
VTEASGYGDRIGTGCDQSRSVTMPKCIEGDARQTARIGESLPVLGDAIRITELALYCPEHESVCRQSADANREP